MEVDTRHADLGKSQFETPCPYLRDKLNTIQNHDPIVGSSAAGRATRVWRGEPDTEAFAAALAAAMRADPALANVYIELHGDLGAGKTTLVRHLLRALGVAGRIKSPTYAVVEPHEAGDLAIWHFDFYRFDLSLIHI